MLPMTYYSGSQFSVYHGDGGGHAASLPRVREDPYAIPHQQQQMPYLPPVDYGLPPPVMYQEPPDAVECRGLMKTYGRGKGKTKALNNVNMNVEQGSIYGLLGPSGCGKTTLLSCIVGRLRPDAGTIRVFGQKPGHKDSGVPGSLIGYMPQDIALYQQFSIEETLKYFGRLHGMPMSDIKHRSQFLVRFLGLPNTSRMVENLSGGQQRRVSLAVALLQKPKLLILDEPTVGVDPLLRYSIWQHLVNLARDEGTSVVITTHYIEEARQANRVGLMRNGALLAQASPESLLIAHRLPTLEDVFLKLCQSVDGLQKTRPGGEQQGVGFLAAQRQKQLEYAQANGQLRHGGNQMSQVSDSWALVQNRDRATSSSSDESTEEGTSTTRNGSGSNRPTSMPNGNAKARIGKMNGEATYDNPIFTLTGNGHGNGDASGKKSRRPENMVSGASQLDSKFGNQGLFHGGIDPHPIKTRAKRGRSYVPTLSTMRALIIKNFISMFRHYGALAFEIFLPPFQIVLFCLTLSSDPKGLGLAIFNEEVNYTSPFNATCDSLMYSCDLFEKLGDRKEILTPQYYPSLDEANGAVLKGDAWGSVHIKQNFSFAIIDRGLLGLDVSNETIDDSRIDVRLDMTNQQVAFIIQREIMFGFQEFFEATLIDSGYNPMLASVPVNFAEPIYGVKEPLYTEFVAPGMLVMITFFMALGLTAMAFVLERKQGLIYRSYVAGVKNVEVLVCYMITQICVLVIQIALTLLVMLLAFEVPNRGSVWIISLLCFMQGICGMSFGLVISALFNDETSTIVACLGIFLPCLLLSGMCWPREGMMPFLHYISAILPQTFGTDALRAVMSKGNGLSQYAVYMGFVIPGAWTVFQMCVSSLFVHLKEGF